MIHTNGDKVILKTLQHDIDGVLRIIDETYQLIEHRAMKIHYTNLEKQLFDGSTNCQQASESESKLSNE